MKLDLCNSSGSLQAIYIIKILLTIVCYLLPLLLIIALTFEISKVVTDPSKVKEVVNMSKNKIIAALIIIFLPTIINIVLGLMGEAGSIAKCYNNAVPSYISTIKAAEMAAKTTTTTTTTTTTSKYAPISGNALNVKSGAYEHRNYYEVIPPNPTENMPMIIFLHGYVNNMGMTTLKNLPICKYVASNEAFKVQNFIFIAPITNSGWNAKNVMNLINQVADQYKVDKTRIYITGHSMGGGGVWSIVNKYPDTFAAAMPMSQPAPSDVKASNFKTTPIYAICGESEALYARQMGDFVNQINAAGGNAVMDVRENKNHSSVTGAYSSPKLFEWMLSHKR